MRSRRYTVCILITSAARWVHINYFRRPMGYHYLSAKVTLTDCRSRYGKFICQKSVLTVLHIRRHVAQREREPSRIPAKELSRLFKKYRKLRKLIRKHIKNNVPRSSRIHCFACAFSDERKKLLSGRVTFLLQLSKKTKRLQVESRRRRKQKAVSQTSVFLFKSSKNRCKSCNNNNNNI